MAPNNQTIIVENIVWQLTRSGTESENVKFPQFETENEYMAYKKAKKDAEKAVSANQGRRVSAKVALAQQSSSASVAPMQRGRKPKAVAPQEQSSSPGQPSSPEQSSSPVPKKRGRKPKAVAPPEQSSSPEKPSSPEQSSSPLAREASASRAGTGC